MRADYDSIHTVRLSRRWGWGLASLIGVLVVIMLGWRMLDVAGQRSEAATLENLHAGLNRLALEEAAQGRTLHRHWLQANPFAQLRWQAAGYQVHQAANCTSGGYSLAVPGADGAALANSSVPQGVAITVTNFPVVFDSLGRPQAGTASATVGGFSLSVTAETGLVQGQ